MTRQLIGTWLIGSAVMGTVALILTADADGLPFRPLVFLSGPALLSLLILVAAMFFALFALGWRTQDASWLRSDPRAALLWPILVGGGGLVGFGFAAAVTFDAEFSLTAQLILGYVSGGLPFTLIAAMLARPVKLNLAAAMLTAIALLTGLVMMTAPIQTCVLYLQLLFGPVGRPL